MHSAVWGARAPRSGWAPFVRWVLGGAVVVILGTFIATGAVAWHEGYRLYAVKTGSMTPGLPVGSLLVDKPATGSYQRGDIVTVARPHDDSNPVVTHRVYSVGQAGIRTKGDANPDPDVFVAKIGNVIGEVAHTIPRGGYVLVYFSQWTGVASLVTVLLTLWLAWGMCFPSASAAPAARRQGVAGPRIPRQRPATIVPGAPTPASTVPAPRRPRRQLLVSGRSGPASGAEAAEVIPGPRGPSA